MAETTDTDDTDALAGTGTIGDEGVVDGYTTAHERGGELGGETLRDGDSEGSRPTPCLSVTTERLVAVKVLAVVGHGELVAVGLLLHLAGGSPRSTRTEHQHRRGRQP